MLAAILVSCGVVFLAELGDKSQLITLTYSLRHRWWVVLSGVGIASFLVHGLSVTIGHFLGLSLPARPIAFAAALAFIGFSIWTLRETFGKGSFSNGPFGNGPSGNGQGGRPVVAEESAPTAGKRRYVVAAIVSSFVLAELGDKTMLATVALASDQNWAGVWIGATVGMVLADGVAIAAGTLLHRRLPERLLHLTAAVLFLLFGLWILFDSALGLRGVAIGVTTGVVMAAALAAVIGVHRSRRAVRHSKVDRHA